MTEKCFEDMNKAIVNGIAALQFDTRISAVDAVSSVEKFAALYSSSSELVAQKWQNQQLIDRSLKTVKTAWAVFCEHRLTGVYGYLAKLMKLTATLPVTSASAKRVHNKLKLVKSALQSRSADVLSSSDICGTWHCGWTGTGSAGIRICTGAEEALIVTDVQLFGDLSALYSVICLITDVFLNPA